jgi:hypothetical protein
MHMVAWGGGGGGVFFFKKNYICVKGVWLVPFFNKKLIIIILGPQLHN